MNERLCTIFGTKKATDNINPRMENRTNSLETIKVGKVLFYFFDKMWTWNRQTIVFMQANNVCMKFNLQIDLLRFRVYFSLSGLCTGRVSQFGSIRSGIASCLSISDEMSRSKPGFPRTKGILRVPSNICRVLGLIISIWSLSKPSLLFSPLQTSEGSSNWLPANSRIHFSIFFSAAPSSEISNGLFTKSFQYLSRMFVQISIFAKYI